MLGVLLAMGSMALKDALMTWLTIAEARGRAWLAGGLDAAGDLASILVVVTGAGAVIKYGWTGHTAVILAAMCVTSFLGTALWTRIGRRI